MQVKNGKEEFIKDLAKSHAELLYLHPFREGNGRTARLFATLIILKYHRIQIGFSLTLKGVFWLLLHAVKGLYFTLQPLLMDIRGVFRYQYNVANNPEAHMRPA